MMGTDLAWYEHLASVALQCLERSYQKYVYIAFGPPMWP